MAANKVFRLGPVALSSTLTTNICNPATVTGGVASGSSPLYIVLRHIRIVNKTGTAATYSLYISTTGDISAGKEFMGTAKSVAANSAEDWYGAVRLDSTDFLVGGSGTATALTLTGEGEIGVSG